MNTLFAPNWSAKIEYNYLDFDRTSQLIFTLPDDTFFGVAGTLVRASTLSSRHQLSVRRVAGPRY